MHFHEVGALDAIADVVGAAPGSSTSARRPVVVVSPVAVGSGHGRRPPTARCPSRRRRSPSCCAASRRTPARRRPRMELCTPTGAALLTTLATGWGPQPAMTVDADRRRRRRPGPAGPRQRAAAARRRARLDSSRGRHGRCCIETNVDDLDPRVWPAVIAALLEAGASDAWLTPILMKKGRPAHTLSVLVDGRPRGRRPRRDLPADLHDRRCASSALDKHALDREMVVGRGRRPADRGQAAPATTAWWSTPSRSTTTWPAPRPRSAGPVADVLADAVAASRSSCGEVEPASRWISVVVAPDLRRDLRGRAARQDVHRDAGARHEVTARSWSGSGSALAFAVQTRSRSLLGQAASLPARRRRPGRGRA